MVLDIAYELERGNPCSEYIEGPYLDHSADLVGFGCRLAVVEQSGPLHVLQLRCLPWLVQ